MPETEMEAGPDYAGEPNSGEVKVPASRLTAFVAKPRLAIWKMAGPAMAGLLVHTFYSVVDTAYVGLLGTAGLAAITRSVPVFLVMIALTAGLGSGATAAIARAIGCGDRTLASRVATTALGLGLVLGVGFCFGGLIIGSDMAVWLGSTGPTRDLTWDYLQLIFYGAPIFFLSVFMRCMLIGEGDAHSPMLIMSGALLLNLLLDPLFIFSGQLGDTFSWLPWPLSVIPVLGMGTGGAALATVVAQGFSFFAYAWIFFVGGRTFVKFDRPTIRPNYKALMAILRVGMPTAASQIIMGVSLGLLMLILKPFGDRVVAGYGAGMRVDMIVVVPIFGLSSALVTVVGMFRGAERMDLVRKVTRYTYFWSIGLATVCGLLAWLSSSLVLRLFCHEEEVVAVGRQYLGWMVFAYPFMAFGVTSGRLLQGCGLGLPTLVITGIRLLVVTVPLGWLLVRNGVGPSGVWIALITGGGISNVVAGIWVRAVLRQKK